MGLTLDVCLASIGLPHDGLTLRERSLGGSETAAIHVSRALAARGHRVTVFSPLPERRMGDRVVKGGSWDGVQWAPLEQWVQYGIGTPHDVTIISRDLNLLRAPYATKVKVLWCHDLAIKRVRHHIGSALWNTDALYVLSPFQQHQYQEVYGLPPDRLFVTRNGIDLDAFRAIRGLPRDPEKLVYGSRPERGLEAALNIMDRLRRAGSRLRLEVSFYDDPNLAPQLQPYYTMLRDRAAAMPNVKILGPLVQAEWHKQLATARAAIAPGCVGDFREISYIGAMEAQACGTPMVAIAKGAIPGTLDGAGLLIGTEQTDVNAPAYQQAFADAVVQVATDDVLWQRLHRQGLDNAKGLTWAGVAEQWEQHWLAILAARISDPARMRAHFRRIGDREALVAFERLSGGGGSEPTWGTSNSPRDAAVATPAEPLAPGTVVSVEPRPALEGT